MDQHLYQEAESILVAEKTVLHTRRQLIVAERKHCF